MTFPDCLVLKIEEYDISDEKLDTSMFIIYDQLNQVYLVRGARVETKRLSSAPYSFTCERAKDLADFISVAICAENRTSYILYNYNDLPQSSSDITYDMLYEEEDETNEVAGRDNMIYDRKALLKYLGMLRNVFNCY